MELKGFKSESVGLFEWFQVRDRSLITGRGREVGGGGLRKEGSANNST